MERFRGLYLQAIAQTGTHGELIGRSGLYQTLWWQYELEKVLS
ncbi:MAG: hypothetical protein ACK58N_03300 [Synechocystis sp.]